MNIFLIIISYIVCAPLIGGLLAGVDRKITARMQSRVGPPVLQPFFDVLKLLLKENLVVRRSQNFYIWFYLFFIVFTGVLFFTGEDLLLSIFALTLAEIFFVLGAYKTSSPYSFLGAQRELFQIMAYEPMILLSIIGMYMVTGSFYIIDIVRFQKPLVFFLPGLCAGVVYILAIKFRKSPFDLSMSHHAHQELVRGITTEFSGRTLAMIEVAHWYEYTVILGFVYLFFASNPVAGIMSVLVVFFLQILIDNVFARVKWQLTIQSCWLVALTAGLGNLIVLYFIRK
ncbi:MAG: NADH-quinone oxidoreductase subunit H [Candidatus Omnitrophica bacterium]|nr:NADH-quinone oxidoreductase subunit H [Candidatus Omnitrophota bacterium]